MSDENATPAKKPRVTKSDDTAAAETIASPESVDVVEVTEVEDVPVEAVPVDEVVVEDDVVTSVPKPQIIYVTAPAAPRPAGNRGFGALIALLATLLFVVVLAVVRIVGGLIVEGGLDLDFLREPLFYAPVLAFLIGFVLLVVIVNRAAWWTYIIGSIIVGVFVYFATIGFGLLAGGAILDGPSALFGELLASPFVIVSALLAREVSMWVGAGIAARGRRVKARNVTARETYDRELAEKRAEHERGAATAV